jgi:4-hydroxybenzoate polyprenyltransferase
MRSAIRYIFFGNYFYGLCAVALCIETAYQLSRPLNSFLFYTFIFSATVLYYTRAYITEKNTGNGNPRSQWYFENRKFVFASQVVLTIVAAAYPLYLLLEKLRELLASSPLSLVILAAFPLTAAFYYGVSHPALGRFRLRKIGWLKPFIIGFVWAGLVTIYPIVLGSVEDGALPRMKLPDVFLFTKNFMFVTVLCIMFDIKDYAADHNRQLKTFVVKAGLRKTIFVILLPLCVLGLGAYLLYAALRDFSYFRILMNVIPFVLLIVVTYSMHRRKSIFYYLVVIDGLMLVKAVFGILGAV